MGRGKHRTVNAHFQAMVSHYLIEAEFSNPAAGWEKGQIEKNVRDSRHRIWLCAPTFQTLNDLNDWNNAVLFSGQTANTLKIKSRTIEEVWREKRDQLMLIPTAFDGFVEYCKRVSFTCLITFDNNRYSVPSTFANRPVSRRQVGGGY